jgi:uncharacterized protein YjbI with pentapeptide repeats
MLEHHVWVSERRGCDHVQAGLVVTVDRTLHTSHGVITTQLVDPQELAAQCMSRLLKSHHNLHGADLTLFVSQWPCHKQSLAGINWKDADLTECVATNIDFSGGTFERSVLMRATLHHSNFSQCMFLGTIMDAAGFDHCCFDGSEFVSIKQTGKQARHALRSQLDEFLPFDRVLARSADFAHASMCNCLFEHANFSSAMMMAVDFTNSIIENCCFEGVVFTNANFAHCDVYRSDMISSTLNLITSNEAVFRSNDYFQMPMPRTIADASFSLIKQVKNYVIAEFCHWKTLTPQVRTDYDRVLLIKLVVFLSVPLLALLAWHFVETNQVVSMITALGAINTFALRRYWTMLLQAIFGFVLGKINDADGLWRRGMRHEAILSLIKPQAARRALRNR